MIIYPAIDLKNGVCVRLKRGQMNQATVYNTDPAEQAYHFQQQGFLWLHLVDLNGAFVGKVVNDKAVESILAAVHIPIQLGGGLRNLESITYWLEKGIKRVVLGTSALYTPSLVYEACRLFPGCIAISIDARDGYYVAVNGWSTESSVTALQQALRYEDSGISAIIHTDINRDGVMGGLNVEATANLASHLTIPVIASGGVSSLYDLEELKVYQSTGIEGVIIGRALYDGRIDPRQALRMFQTS